ncbi:MAG: DUF935 family protein [Candidatus Edwardsbacteria bacterium]|nr:DUF935 family protein [Candidatus Edwardsbacteria bacterium]
MSRKIWINPHTAIDLSENTAPISSEIATRRRSIDYASLLGYLPNPDPVLKKMGKDIDTYSELQVDAHLGGCVTSRKSGTKALNWAIDRGKAKSRQAKIIEDCFNNLDLDQIISEILDAPLYGYQVSEVMWEQVGQYVLPRAVVGKPQNWFVFDPENQLRFRTKENWVNGEALPDRKFLLAQHEASYTNPYGFPVLSRCFWPATFKKGGLKFWVVFTEKYGMPWLVGKHPRGAQKAEIDKIADDLEAMVQDAIAVIPEDASLDIKEPGGKTGSVDVYDRLLGYCKSEMSIAVLGQNLTTQVEGGSYAATTAHMEVRQNVVDSDCKLVEKVLNRMIGWIYEINFASGDRPKFSMYAEEDVDSALAERDSKLAATGQVQFTKQYFQREYGFEDGDFEVTRPQTGQPGMVFPGMPSMPAEPAAEAPLNGAQIQAAVSVLMGISAKTISGPAAMELLTAVGIPENAAQRIVQAQAKISIDNITDTEKLKAFSEAVVSAVSDQTEIDTMARGQKPEMQAQADKMLLPVVELINQGKDFSEVLGKLAGIFPNMDDSALQEKLSRAVFIGKVWGRLNAGK